MEEQDSPRYRREPDVRSAVLPTDPLDVELAKLMGLPNGAHTQPAVTQVIDPYGNVTNYTVQTVRSDLGNTVFVWQTSAAGPKNYILPPKVLALMARQADTVTAKIRSRHGRRLAEQRQANGHRPVFTAAMRAKALATRKAKAAKRAARRAAKKR
jgi:hypothetical protein